MNQTYKSKRKSDRESDRPPNIITRNQDKSDRIKLNQTEADSVRQNQDASDRQSDWQTDTISQHQT